MQRDKLLECYIARGTPPGGLELLLVAPLDSLESFPAAALDARAPPRLPPLQLRALAALPLRDQVCI